MHQCHSGPETISFHFVIAWSRSERHHEQSQVKQLAVPGAGQGTRVCVTPGTAHVLHSTSVQQLWFWTALFDLAQDISQMAPFMGCSQPQIVLNNKNHLVCRLSLPSVRAVATVSTPEVNSSVPAPAPALLCVSCVPNCTQPPVQR